MNMRLAQAVPQALRTPIRKILKWFGDPPARLVLPRTGDPDVPSIRVIVYGTAWHDWTVALANVNLWREIPGVHEVIRVAKAAGARKRKPYFPDSSTTIIPLVEEYIRNCPGQYKSLTPDRLAVETLCNKALFALYVQREKLGYLSPVYYNDIKEVIFPCVLKRADLFSGIGIEIAESFPHLQSLLENEMWRNKDVVLQSVVLGTTEYVTHCVCVDGRIIWNCSFAYEMSKPDEIRKGADGTKIRPYTAPEHVLAQIAKFLSPLRFTGPCNVNYKFCEKGEIVVFEINPRFGGSLMMPNNIAFLREALCCIIKNARFETDARQGRWNLDQ